MRELPQLIDPIGSGPGAFRRRRRVANPGSRRPGGCDDASSSTVRPSTASSALRTALLKHPEVSVGTLTEKLLTYALGRGIEAYDMPTVRGHRAGSDAAGLPVLGSRGRGS